MVSNEGVLTNSRSEEIKKKIKHSYTIPKLLPNWFNDSGMVLLNANNCFLFIVEEWR